MKSKQDIFVPGALALTEQAIHLLRQKGGAALACYYIGSLPFLLGLLYFWSDMSRSPDAGWYCGPAAAGMALLFIWMKVWQVRFCRRLWCALQDSPPEPWTWRHGLAAAARQSALQATGMLILPLAAVIMLPMAWTYAFYQNLSVMDGPDTRNLRGLYADASRQALLWPGQNHVLLLLISAFSLIVLLNAAAGLMLLPYLLKWLMGIETAFTISGVHAMTNTTFAAIVCALAYLCVDPVVKAVYTLRCFYGRSRRRGDDLHAGFKPFLAVVLLAVLLWSGSVPSTWAHSSDRSANIAREAHQSALTPREDDIEQLDRAIDEVLTQRRFAWRLPGEKTSAPPEERKGWFWDSLHWLGEKIDAVFEVIDGWLEAFSEWLRKHLPKGEGTLPGGGNWDAIIRGAFYVIGGGLVILLLLLIRNRLRNRRPVRSQEAGGSSVEAIDLNDETITADDLPQEQWLTLAREMMTRREYRQALRAFYLSLLAQLGDRNRIVIARYKSNRDYLGELSRRSHAEPELLDLFGRCVALFERAWYGMHPVAEKQLSQFVSNQERIAQLVQQATSA